MRFSKGFKYAFAAAVAWSICIIISRIILNNGENPYNLVFWITLLSLPFWIYIFSARIKEFKTLTRKQYRILIAIALVSTIGVNITESLALKYSPAINYSLLIRSVIFFTFIFAYLFLKEKITFQKIIISILILIGTYLLISNGKLISFTLGDFFTLTEAALIAFGNNVLGRLATRSMSVYLSASVTFLIGLIPIIIIAALNNAIGFPKYFILTIALTIFSVALIMFRFNAYKNYEASKVTLVYSFTPFFVSLIAIPLLNESMSLIQIIGGVLIVLASLSVDKA